MLIKLFLAIVLSISVSCFAESRGGELKSLIDTSQQTQSSTNASQKTESSSSDSIKKEGESQSPQGTSPNPPPTMIEYCRENPC